jgi:hypothetical protein
MQLASVACVINTTPNLGLVLDAVSYSTWQLHRWPFYALHQIAYLDLRERGASADDACDPDNCGEVCETWLRAPWAKASAMQRPLPDGVLKVVLRGPKQDGDMDLVNLASQISQPRSELPLPLVIGTPY